MTFKTGVCKQGYSKIDDRRMEEMRVSSERADEFDARYLFSTTR